MKKDYCKKQLTVASPSSIPIRFLRSPSILHQLHRRPRRAENISALSNELGDPFSLNYAAVPVAIPSSQLLTGVNRWEKSQKAQPIFINILSISPRCNLNPGKCIHPFRRHSQVTCATPPLPLKNHQKILCRTLRQSVPIKGNSDEQTFYELAFKVFSYALISW
mgnify:CR=1 FL=1